MIARTAAPRSLLPALTSARILAVPAVMALIYLTLLIYFKTIGGYKPVHLADEEAPGLLEAAKHADSRGCLVLLGAILDTPGLAERLLQVLKPNGHSGENGKRKPDSNARGEEIL